MCMRNSINSTVIVSGTLHTFQRFILQHTHLFLATHCCQATFTSQRERRRSNMFRKVFCRFSASRGFGVPQAVSVAARHVRVNSLISRSLKIDHKNMSPVDVEKELFRLKRRMGALYSQAAYGEALKVAKELNREIIDIMGTGNTVHAGNLNNIGLILKKMGDKEDALKKYEEALAIYDKEVGQNHVSYLVTAGNLGVLYMEMADSAESKEEASKYIGLAEITLEKTLTSRIELEGIKKKDVLINQVHLSSVYSRKGDVQRAEDTLRSLLKTCREESTIGNWDSITALVLNNLGLILKRNGNWNEAEDCYKEARDIREETLGEKHHDTILSMHNLAELYLSRGTDGDQERATNIQQKILDILGDEYKSEDWSDEAIYESLPSNVKQGKVLEKVEQYHDEVEIAKTKNTKAQKPHQKEGQEGHSMPAGETAGQSTSHSAESSPVTDFFKQNRLTDEDNKLNFDDDTVKKLYDKMLEESHKRES